MVENIVKIINDLIDPPTANITETSNFEGVPHDDILEAYQYWLQYLKLLVKEPFTIQIIQGQQDEGVDLVLEFLNSDKKIGLQVKSYNDLKQENFREKLMSQITYSKKHGIVKLFVILCADMQNRSQSSKVRNMMSQASQMQDNYISIISPQKVYPIYECYNNKKHPFVYLARNKQIINLIHGLSESLSTKEYKAEISVKFNYILPDNVKETHPFSFQVKFKPFQKEKPDNPLDKFTRLYQLKEKVEFTKDDIDEVIVNYPGGRKETFKPNYLKAEPEKRKIGPINICTVNSAEKLVEDIVLYEEHRDQNSATLKTNDEFRPWFFEWIAIQDKKMINFHMDFDGKKGDYRDVLNYLKLLRTIKQNGKIVLEIVPLDKKEEMTIDPSLVREVSDDEITMVENLLYIQERLGQRIPVIDEYIDPSLIQITKDFLESGRLEKPSQLFELSGRKYDVLGLIEKLKKQSPLKKCDFTLLQMSINLGKTQIKLPPIKITMKNVILNEDIDNFEKKISSLQDDENVIFTLKPTTQENIVYELQK